MRTLASISVTPVKGTALHHPQQVDLTPIGIPTNRRFFFVDETGKLFSGSSFGPLVQIHAEHDPVTEWLTLTFPDGFQASGRTDRLGRVHTTDYYGRPVPAHEVDGPFDEAVTAYVGRPLHLLRCDRDGDGADVLPLTVVSGASVADLAARGRREAPLDARRFRINLEFDGCEPYDEDAWDGGDVRIGDATVRVAGQIPRCVVTTQAPETGQKDWDTLTQIAKYRPRIPEGGLPFGMYAQVVTPGRVRVGDPVDPIDEAGPVLE